MTTPAATRVPALPAQGALGTRTPAAYAAAGASGVAGSRASRPSPIPALQAMAQATSQARADAWAPVFQRRALVVAKQHHNIDGELVMASRYVGELYDMDVVELSQVEQLLTTEKEVLVAHGHAGGLGGYSRRELISLLRQRMKPLTPEPYRLEFMACQTGMTRDGKEPFASQVQGHLARAHVNVSITAPTGLVNVLKPDEDEAPLIHSNLDHAGNGLAQRSAYTRSLNMMNYQLGFQHAALDFLDESDDVEQSTAIAQAIIGVGAFSEAGLATLRQRAGEDGGVLALGQEVLVEMNRRSHIPRPDASQDILVHRYQVACRVILALAPFDLPGMKDYVDENDGAMDIVHRADSEWWEGFQAEFLERQQNPSPGYASVADRDDWLTFHHDPAPPTPPPRPKQAARARPRPRPDAGAGAGAGAGATA